MAKDAGLGANLLLNIGPMPNGVIQPEFVKVLDSVGTWLKTNGESIYGTQPTDAKLHPWGIATKKGNTLYLHLLDQGTDTLMISGLPFKKLKTATVLSTGARLEAVQFKKNQLFLSRLQAVARDPDDTVIKIEF